MQWITGICIGEYAPCARTPLNHLPSVPCFPHRRMLIRGPLPPRGGEGFGAKPSDVAAVLAVGGVKRFIEFTKIHQATALAHRFCFSLVASRGTDIQDPQSNNLQCRVQSANTLPWRSALQLHRIANSGAVLTSQGLHRCVEQCSMQNTVHLHYSAVLHGTTQCRREPYTSIQL